MGGIMQTSLEEEMTSTLKVRVATSRNNTHNVHRGLYMKNNNNKNLKYLANGGENQVIKWQFHKHCVIQIYLH